MKMKYKVIIRTTFCLFLLAVGCKKESLKNVDSVSVQQKTLDHLSQKRLEEDAMPSPPSFQADNRVAQLFHALKNNDFGTVYKMDFLMQNSAAYIRLNSPQFLVEKELQEEYEKQKSQFDQGNSYDYSQDTLYAGTYFPLIIFVRLNPDTEIIEIRDTRNPDTTLAYRNVLAHEVYVKLKFKPDAMLDWYSGAKLGKLKATVVKLVFTDTGYFIVNESGQIHDADDFISNS